MRIFFLAFTCFVMIGWSVQAQYRINYNIRVDKGFDSLQYAWTGGLNNPQFSAADLNNDGILDLVIFDRADNKVLTFINHGTPGKVDYSYAPEYQKYFPSMNNWMLMLDFNCDGIPDIFTSATLGISVYKGYYVNNHLTFSLYCPLIEYDYVGDSGIHYRLNLPVTGIDIPAIGDFNNDGNIDIITKDIGGGNYDQYYQNTSSASGHGCDSLFYKLIDPCWGKFYEALYSDKKYLDQPCPFSVLPPQPPPTDSAFYANATSRHSGSTTLVFDNNGDGKVDAFMGNISFNNIVYMVNGDSGTNLHADFISQDTTFPSYNVPSNVVSFPAPFRLDVNNDGVQDLIFAPNAASGSNFNACSWFYKNIGTNSVGNFQFQTDSFLVNQMIDVGSCAKPVFFDYDQDSLMDIVIGNEAFYGASSTLTLYRNTGTKTKPRFKYMTSDYANLSSLNLQFIHPTFGDIRGAGVMDMIVGCENGRLYYFRNDAAPGMPASFSLQDTNFLNNFRQSYTAPQLVDVNGDGLLDLLVGTLSGPILYYQNTGTATNPVFSSTPTSSHFGGINVNLGVITVMSVPFMTNLPGFNEPVLLVGDALGRLQLFDGIQNNLNGTFNLVTPYYSNISTGYFEEGFYTCSISAADINGDGANELAVGVYRGGFHIYDTSSVDLDDFPSGISTVVYNPKINVYPNPASDQLTILADNTMVGKKWNLTITDLLGRQVINRTTNFNSALETINVSALSSGLYIIDISNNTNKFEKKFVKQ